MLLLAWCHSSYSTLNNLQLYSNLFRNKPTKLIHTYQQYNIWDNILSCSTRKYTEKHIKLSNSTPIFLNYSTIGETPSGANGLPFAGNIKKGIDGHLLRILLCWTPALGLGRGQTRDYLQDFFQSMILYCFCVNHRPMRLASLKFIKVKINSHSIMKLEGKIHKKLFFLPF